MNERISETLSKATGQYVTAAPDAWWKWWNDYNEVLDLGTKPTDGVYLRERVAFASPYSGPSGSSGGSGAAYECLVAGTLVWTDVGPTPIEEIKVGDRVLAQDPESGELGFKPVLRTSTRPPTSLLRIQAGGEPIQCSGGHPFWVSGDGWTKARFLKPQSQLHCVTGTAQIRSIEESGFETTYNLVVADFHTYFVGKGKILTHDNTIRKPASTVVPGLKDE